MKLAGIIAIFAGAAALAAAFSDNQCEMSDNAIMKYEQRILQAIVDDPDKIEAPLKCLMEVQQNGEGMNKYFANKFLRPMMGADMPDGIVKDKRYAAITKHLEKNPEMVVNGFAKGDWGFYKLFCEVGDTSFCPAMMPDEFDVQTDAPLLAASSILKLRQAYLVLGGSQKREIAERIKFLHQTIPAQQKIQRQFIEQIYKELFGPVSVRPA